MYLRSSEIRYLLHQLTPAPALPCLCWEAVRRCQSGKYWPRFLGSQPLKVPSPSLLSVLVALCWILSGLYLSCCKLKTEHPAPDSDLPVLGKGELSICPQCSLYHCVGTLLNPRSWVSQDLRSPLQSCSQTSHLSCTHGQSVPYWRQDFAYHQEVSESPVSPLNGLTIFWLAIFLAVLVQGAYYLWECQPALWQHAESVT